VGANSANFLHQISTDTGQVRTIKPDMQNQHNNLQGLARAFWEIMY